MKNLLKNHSFNIDAVEFFIAQRDAEGEWETDIKKQLNDANFLVCIATNRLRSSHWVTFEVGAFWQSGKDFFMFGLELDEKIETDIPSPLLKFHIHDSFNAIAPKIFKKLLPDSSIRAEELRKENENFNTEIAEHMAGIRLEKEIEESDNEKNVRIAAQWEMTNDDILNTFYVVLPEYLPLNSSDVYRAMIHNIKEDNTTYRYLFHKEGCQNADKLEFMIQSILEDDKLLMQYSEKENIEDLKDKIKKSVFYTIVDVNNLLDNFLFRTQVWFKELRGTRVENNGYLVLLEEDNRIKSMREIKGSEAEDLFMSLRRGLRSWDYINAYTNKKEEK